MQIAVGYSFCPLPFKMAEIWKQEKAQATFAGPYPKSNFPLSFD
jgi:hypothetical protein